MLKATLALVTLSGLITPAMAWSRLPNWHPMPLGSLPNTGGDSFLIGVCGVTITVTALWLRRHIHCQ